MSGIGGEEGQREHGYGSGGEIFYFFELSGEFVGDGVILARVAVRVGDLILIKVAKHFESASFAGPPALCGFLGPDAHR